MKRLQSAFAALFSVAAMLAAAWISGYAPIADVQIGQSSHLVSRSGRWPTVRKNHLEKHPACEACGETEHVEVHHIEPFHQNPAKELDPTNLITLCRFHHRMIGHPGGWDKSNPNVVSDARRLYRNSPADAERVANKTNPTNSRNQ